MGKKQNIAGFLNRELHSTVVGYEAISIVVNVLDAINMAVAVAETSGADVVGSLPLSYIDRNRKGPKIEYCGTAIWAADEDEDSTSLMRTFWISHLDKKQWVEAQGF